MEDNSQVWQLKAINKLLPSTEDQRSASSFDTDDETNMIAAANSTRLHRLHLSQQPRISESARNSRVSDVSRSRPFPAHQAVLDTLISSKSNGSADTQKEQAIGKTKQPILKDAKQASIRSSSNGLRKAEDKPRLAVFKPERQSDISTTPAKKLTPPTSSTDQKLTQVNLRRSHSKPGRMLMTCDDNKYLKTVNTRTNVTSSNHAAKNNNNNNNNNNVLSANCRSSFDPKNSKTKSSATPSHNNNNISSDVASKSRKFDDNDEFLLSPQSPQPPDDVIASVISAKTTAMFKTTPPANKILDARQNCKLSKPADSIFKINNRSNLQPSTTSTDQSSPASESPIVVPPPPQLLSIDSSRWKRSPASPTTDVRNVSCDVSSGLTRVNRRFSDKRDVSSTPTSDKDEASQGSQNDELRRLRQDLQWAKDQVTLLTSHLCTNTKVVEAFDSSLIKMLQKLHHLSTNSNNNQDLNRLIDTIEALRQQNINHCIRHRLAGYQADYPGDRSDSRGFVTSSYYSEYGYDDDDDDNNSLAASEVSVRQPRSRKYRHESETDMSPEREKLGYFKSKLKSKKSRLKDTDSSPDSESKSVKQWLKNSFGRALSRIRTPSISSSMTSSSKKDLHVSSLPSIPLQAAPRPLSMDYHPMSYAPSTGHTNMTFTRYEQRGHDLPSPSSALGSEVRGETRSRSNQRFASKFFQPLKAEIELPIRPATSLANPYHRRSDSSDQIPAGLELRANKRADGQHVTVSVSVDQVDDNTKQYTFVQGNQIQIPIGTLKVGDSMTWIVLDRLIKKTFEDHLTKLDPTSKLGMDGESILSYQVGEIVRPNDDASFLLHPPELLPIGYLVGDVTNICISLKGYREGCVDALAFELLISKASLSSYVHLLISHKRIILIGSSGTGKSHLAKRLACYMVDLMLNWGESSRGQFESEFGSSRDLFPPLPLFHHNHHHHHNRHHHHQHLHPDKSDQSNLIAMYRVDSQSSRELRQYLNNMAVQYQDLYCRQEHLMTSSSSSLSSPSSSSTPALEAGEKEIIRTEASKHHRRHHDDRASVTSADVKRKSKENESETKSPGKSRNYRNNSTPLVIVLDNLHHVTSLGDAFCGFFDLDLKTGPYVIGTMQWSRTMATASSLNSSPLNPSPNLGGTGASTPNPPGPPGDLQFHHNFRWIIYSSKVDPVRGFLGRYLSRCFVASTVAKTSLFSRRSLALPGTADGFLTGGTPLTSSLLDLHLSKVIDWLPQAWQRINEYLEASSTRDITLGPRLFLSCPMEASRAHLWFVDLWNYSIVPYLMEALKNKNHQTMKITWTRLVDWLTSSVPWKGNLDKSSCPLFLNFRPEDLGPFPTEQHNNRTGSNYSSEVTSEDKLRSKGQVTGDDDDDDDEVFNREASNDFSLDDIVSRFQAAAVKSSSSETGSVNATLNLE